MSLSVSVVNQHHDLLSCGSSTSVSAVVVPPLLEWLGNCIQVPCVCAAERDHFETSFDFTKANEQANAAGRFKILQASHQDSTPAVATTATAAAGVGGGGKGRRRNHHQRPDSAVGHTSSMMGGLDADEVDQHDEPKYQLYVHARAWVACPPHIIS